MPAFMRCHALTLRFAQSELHQSHPFAMNKATMMMLITAIGRKTFQPSFISRSYLSRGTVQRTQTKTKRQKQTFIVKKIIVDNDDHHVPGSCHPGRATPPKKSGTGTAAR